MGIPRYLGKHIKHLEKTTLNTLNNTLLPCKQARQIMFKFQKINVVHAETLIIGKYFDHTTISWQTTALIRQTHSKCMQLYGFQSRGFSLK